MSKHGDLENARVLLVEDNKINQFIMGKLLSSMNIKPMIANHGKEAIELVKTHEFDVILMDVHMPIMDGLEATRIIKANKSIIRQPAILALTANAFKESEEECVEAGMDDYLTKPVTFDKLKSRITNALKQQEVNT